MSWLLLLLLLLIHSNDVQSFSLAPFHIQRLRPVGMMAASSVAMMDVKQSFSKKKPSPRPMKEWGTKRHCLLTLKEERALLKQTTELRRLMQLEQELKASSHQVPMLSVRAEAAGYGQDLDAYQNAIRSGERAREKLISHNMRLVHHVVSELLRGKKSSHLQCLTREDLVQEGTLGLARAIDKYKFNDDPSAVGNNKLSTYAYYWIRAAVLRCIAERDNMVRVPQHVTEAIAKLHKTAETFGLGNAVEQSIHANLEKKAWKEATEAKKLAERRQKQHGLSEVQLDLALRAQQRRNNGGYVNLERLAQEKNDNENAPGFAAVVADKKNIMPKQEADFDRALDMSKLDETIHQVLSPREMQAICLRYGLQFNKNDSQSDLARQVRQLYYGGNFGKAAVAANERRRSQLAAATTKDGTVTAMASTPKKRKKKTLKVSKKNTLTFAEIGKIMSISSVTGHNLCTRAITKIKQAVEGQPSALGSSAALTMTIF